MEGRVKLKNPPSVLVIDDDALVHEFLGEVIPTTTGCRTFHAVNLRDGLKLLSQCVPDVILIDRSLPDGQADHWVQEISKESRWRDIPKWFLSGTRPYDWDGEAWKHCGVKGYLVKPVALGRLVEVIQSSVGKERFLTDTDKEGAV